MKKVFLEISQNSQENTCARVSFLIKLKTSACNFIKKETLAQVFSCEFCEISNNTLFTEHLWTTASAFRKRYSYFTQLKLESANSATITYGLKKYENISNRKKLYNVLIAVIFSYAGKDSIYHDSNTKIQLLSIFSLFHSYFKLTVESFRCINFCLANFEI